MLLPGLPNSGVMPGKSIVLAGARGPLQSIAAAGSMKFQLAQSAGDTKLDFTYAVAVTGYLPAGLNTWAPPVGSVLEKQLTRLKNYIEHGNPAPK
jgi:hypothetical protein